MALPPHILRIKRKRGDDPVESLYFEQHQAPSKRRVTTSGLEFVFRRLVESPHTASPLQTTSELQPQSSNGIPQVIATQPGEENDFFRRPQPPAPSLDVSNPASANTKNPSATLPRRFHLSRDSVSPATPAATGGKQRSQHKEVNIAVFVETSNDLGRPPISAENDAKHLGIDNGSSGVSESLAPGASRKKRPRTPATGSRPLTPVRQSNEETASAMHAALQRYAAEEYGHAHPPSEQEIQKPQDQQHLAVGAWKDDDAMDMAPDQPNLSLHDDGDFIYDTYVRYTNTLDDLPSRLGQTTLQDENPASEKPGVAADSGTIGYLVIPEADQTLWETYYASDASSSSERDWDSEEDDENHENYYGADYPEDEVSSEDDRDENPYRYARGSGDEEWGSENEAWSDEDDDVKASSDTHSHRQAFWP